ncbi:MAG: 4Fe-4S dicluster domain-containing protein [Promethearchaeota archaeon]
MKISLIYFSGTGMTACAAFFITKYFKDNKEKLLKSIFKGEKLEIDTFRLTYELKDRISVIFEKSDVIGIGSPTYAYRAPRFVTKILKYVKNFKRSQKIDKRKKMFFIFNTSGGEPGNCLWNIYKILFKKGLFYLGGIEISYETNLRSWMPFKEPFNINISNSNKNSIEKLEIPQNFLEKEELSSRRHNKFYFLENPQNREVTQFLLVLNSVYIRTQLDNIISSIVLENGSENNFQSSIKPKRSLFYSLFSCFLTYSWQMNLGTMGLKRIDKKKCVKCGICARKICPANAIQISTSKNKPLNANYPKIRFFMCVGCNGCVNLCPYDAINSKLTRNRVPFAFFKEFILYI